MEPLDILETLDSKALAWGNVSYSFTRQEYVNALSEFGDESDDVFDQLLREDSIVELDHRDLSGQFRTRMGESVVLFTELRQLLPTRNLQDSASLVSDFRFVRSPRIVPKRDIEKERFFELLSNDLIPAKVLDFARQFLDVSGRFSELAGFQYRAFKEIAGPNQNEGVVVTAGTGSGKSLAFYLPIFSTLASDIKSNSIKGTRVLSIYPRNELLKDQLKELISALVPFNRYLNSQGVRGITVGAFYGDTPQSVSDLADPNKTAKIFKCPNEECDQSLQLKVKNDPRRLRCNSCGFDTGATVVVTRAQMLESPPDILLTSAEMLSQRLTDTRSRHLFGIQRQSRLQFVLMDEIHTYSGVTGAQTALLISRWRKLLSASVKPKFVGLSATLESPESFFASLIGSFDRSVVLVTPQDSEIRQVGSEYLLCLRGDPASKTALLSTTIQAMMLGARILDSIQVGKKRGIWPGKVFTFTDSLDILNRLFFDYLDSEGYKWNSRSRTQEVNPRKINSLAVLRDPLRTSDSNTVSNMSLMGQNWDVLKKFGHRLDRSDIVGDQTSSQASGVNPRANVVVATASLEVGFNDTSVGMVFQHKAPRDTSSYLQRKGRAGRSISTRPWMVVVLSEFGRDRELFLRYESLARPIVESKSLPVRNAHVQKMAGAAAFLDWLSVMSGASWVYGALRNPKSNWHSQDLEKIKRFLYRVVREEDLRDNFADYLCRSLRISPGPEANNILWSIPRGVFSEFLPTLERELDTNFTSEGGVGSTADFRASPAPEYITGQLFGALNVPDITIIPPNESGANSGVETMDFFQAMKEFAPGRISKRYAKWGKDAWVILPSDFELDAAIPRSEREFVISRANGEFADQIVLDNRIPDGSESLPVARPLNLRPSSVKTFNRLNITDRSHAVFEWEVYLEERLKPAEIEILVKGNSKQVGVTYASSLHRHGEQRQITRYSRSSEAIFTTRNRESLAVKFSFVGSDKKPLALGCTNYHDMMEFYFELPDDFSLPGLSDDHKQCLRLSLFDELLRLEFSRSQLLVNNFDIDWLKDCFLGFVLSGSLESSSLESFRLALVGKNVPEELIDTPERMFARDESVDEEDEASEKLYKHLKGLLENQEVFNLLVKAFNAAFDDSDMEAEGVFQNLVERTLAGLVNSLALRALPDLAENLLLAEVLPRDVGSPLCILLSESDPGGCGYLERLRSLLIRETGKATDLLVSCAKPTDSEFVINSIEALLTKELDSSSDGLLEQFRSARSVVEEQEASRKIKRKLLDLGRYPSQTLLNVLHTKILRAGSSSNTDAHTLELIQQWKAINQRHGMEWPLSVFAYAVGTRQGSSNEEIQAKKSQVQDLLYPQGGEIRCNALNFYNRFAGVVSTDRIIAEALMGPVARVNVIDGFDLDVILSSLKLDGAVEVVFSPEEQGDLESLVSKLLVCNVEHKGLLFAPKVSGIRYTGSGVAIKFELPEVL